MILKTITRLFDSLNLPFLSQSYDNLTRTHRDYARYAYPSNHTYKISKGKLTPKRQLAQRYKIIHHLLPHPLTSLAEVGCSKGFFVFSASNLPHATRCLGIDVNEHDILFCRELKTYLKNVKTDFACMRLHELAERINEFGGRFQTVLVLNTYQYLYFGSEYYPQRYLNHDEIFKHLRAICSERVIFNNRINFSDVQINKTVLQATDRAHDYNEAAVHAAASKYFNVTEHGKIGRYPLWTLDVPVLE